MRYYLLATLLALSACATTPTQVRPPVAPVSSPLNRTVLDERIAGSVELAYKAFRTAVEAGVDAGLIKGQTAKNVAYFDRQAYGYLLLMRQAHELGQNDTYLALANNAKIAIENGLAALKGN